MASSIVTQAPDPLSVAAEAIGTFQTNKRQNALDAQAKARADAQLALQQNADARDQTRLTDTETQTGVVNKREEAAAALDAKKEADNALHQARVDAIDKLKEENAKTHNDQQYQIDLKKLNQQYAIEEAKLKSAATVAEIRATAETGAANIRASAEVKSAGISAAARDFATTTEHGDHVAGQAVTKRGQDLAHQDRVSGQDRQTAARIATAITTLRRTPGAPPVPTDDPHFDAALKAFATASPAERDASLADPRIPASTKRYLQAIAPQLTVLGQ